MGQLVSTRLIAFKVVVALLGFAAVVTEIATIVERGTFSPVNFFSYFTIESNVLVSITLLVSALAVAMGVSGRLDVLRSAVTVYILIVGIGFSVLLAGIEDTTLTAVPWDNVVLHYLVPIAVLVDYLLDPPERRLHLKDGLVWLLFPIVYVTYSLVRGEINGWYPYPFLDPETDGYAAVAFTVACLLALGVGLTWLVTRWSGRRQPLD